MARRSRVMADIALLHVRRQNFDDHFRNKLTRPTGNRVKSIVITGLTVYVPHNTMAYVCLHFSSLVHRLKTSFLLYGQWADVMI